MGATSTAALLLEVLKCILILYALCGAGVVMYRAGIVREVQAKALSKIAFYYLGPCLSMVSIGSIMSYETFMELWSVLLMPIVLIVVGYVVALPLLMPFSLPPYYKLLLSSAVAFNNCGDVPITLMETLATTALIVPGMTPEESKARGIGYIQLFGASWNIITWLLLWPAVQVPTVLLPKASIEPELQIVLEEPQTAADPTERSGAASHEMRSRRSLPSAPSASDTATLLDKGPYFEVASALSSVQAAAAIPPVQAMPSVLDVATADKDVAIDQGLGVSSTQARTRPSEVRRRLQAVGKSCLVIIRSPILMGAVTGFIIGMVPALKNLFFVTASQPRPPLEFITNALRTIGQAYIPVVWLVVGNRVGRSVGAGAQRQGQLTSRKLSVVHVLARLLVAPLLWMGVVYGFTEWGVLPKGNPMLSFAITSAGMAPTASTVLVMIELLEAPFGNEVSYLVMLQYLMGLATLPLLIFLTLKVILP